MTEVEALLGKPVSTLSNADGEWHHEIPDVDTEWNYAGEGAVDVFRAVRFHLQFSKGRLVFAHAYHRDSYDRTLELFTLDPDGRIRESRDIERWFRP